MVDCIGVFYSTPSGVVKTYGCFYDAKEGKQVISYYRLVKTTQFKNYYNYDSIFIDETVGWSRLNDIDFPNSADKQLPYSFDLFYDIKRMSQLRRAFKYENTEKLLKMMRDHNIRFEKRNKHAKPRRY